MKKIPDSQLKKILVDPGYLTENEFDSFADRAKESGLPAVAAILESGVISDSQLGQLIAQEWGVPFADLRNEKIDEKALSLIPEHFAWKRSVILFAFDNHQIKAAMSDPSDMETRNFAQKNSGFPLKTYYATPKDVSEALRGYKTDFREILESISEKMARKNETSAKHDSAVEFINNLVSFGVFSQASDMHIEPLRKKAVIRFRIDGLMKKIIEVPLAIIPALTTRVKIMSRIRTDEHRAALDGKFRFELDGKTLDVRVSIVPVVNGENVVMRLLADNQRGFGISNLGLSEKNLGLIKEALKKPHGLILTTGPTGCGKTTTLYEFLKLLNAPEVHIATIEDPVEYDIEGVSQIQVNTATNLTFAKGLRAIVRQDPDVIMVGEIRDEETASIAVNSAMTGHLVLSTLHTNDASTAVPRLLDMGVEPFLISSTLEMILAQRLVRKICEKCRASYQIGDEERILIENDYNLRDALLRKKNNLNKLTFFRGEGCRMCGHTGFRGRVGIFEIWIANQKARDLIMAKASRDEIFNEARKAGMVTMFEDGLEKVFSGLTTLSEIIRVTKEE